MTEKEVGGNRMNLYEKLIALSGGSRMGLRDWSLEDWERWVDRNFCITDKGDYVILVSDLMGLVEEEVTDSTDEVNSVI